MSFQGMAWLAYDTFKKGRAVDYKQNPTPAKRGPAKTGPGTRLPLASVYVKKKPVFRGVPKPVAK